MTDVDSSGGGISGGKVFLYRYIFSRINGESVVPYTVKEGTKYVPLFYFEGETEHLKLKSEVVDG